MSQNPIELLNQAIEDTKRRTEEARQLREEIAVTRALFDDINRRLREMGVIK